VTTPGQQLTPGDDQNPPVFGVPEGAYVGDAGAPNAITDLNNLNEAEAKARMRAPINPSFIAQRDGVWGFFDSLLAIIQGGVNLVVGAVQAVVDGIAGIFNAVGSLFGMSSRDMAAVDQARVAGENAIVARMSESLDQLDEIQRAGGAYMDVPSFRFDNGEDRPHIIPLTAPIELESGTSWIPPHSPLTHSTGYRYPGATGSERDASRRLFAGGSGQLELLESGLWVIEFQASVLQGAAYASQPVDVWCHVTPADSPWIPEGPPGLNIYGNPIPGEQMTQHRNGAEFSYQPDSIVAAYGRASSYIGVRDSPFSGGNSVSGVVMAVLGTGAWKVTLSCNSWEKYSGPMSTYVYATKVNSETLRQDIDQLKDAIADSLPGENVPLDLDEDQIAAMVAQASEIEVPEVEVPND